MSSLIQVYDHTYEVDCSLYQMWLLKPAHAYDLLLQASTKLQVILYHRVLDMDNTTAEDREMETRAFWALVMMEK